VTARGDRRWRSAVESEFAWLVAELKGLGGLPVIRVLGPVKVTDVDSTGHGPRMAHLAALLYFRPGRSADVLCADMDPVSPWSTSTLNARMQGLHSSARTPTCSLPACAAAGPVSFLQLVERALPLGTSGLTRRLVCDRAAAHGAGFAHPRSRPRHSRDSPRRRDQPPHHHPRPRSWEAGVNASPRPVRRGALALPSTRWSSARPGRTSPLPAPTSR
jgi:hypothetical protein